MPVLQPALSHVSSRSVTVTVELVLPCDRPEQLVEELRTFVSGIRSLPSVRSPSGPAQPDPLVTAAVRISRTQRTVLHRDAAVPLTRREFDLLLYLAQHPRQVFTRPQLLSQVWGGGPESGERTVDVHVTRLRRKLTDPVVDTVRGVGYRLGLDSSVAVAA